ESRPGQLFLPAHAAGCRAGAGIVDSTWYYTPDGKTKFGPVSLAELQALVRSGQLLPSHMVRREDMPRWITARTLPRLVPRPLPPPLPWSGAPFKRPGRLLERVGRACRALLSALWAAWRRGYRRVALLRLRRRLRRLQRQQAEFLRALGVRLLAGGLCVPGCES